MSMSGTAYRARRRTTARSDRTRARILEAVRELLSEGTFHESTVEQVAERAGLSRATVYQHFRSRLELVDGICDTLGDNPALLQIRELVSDPDPGRALGETIANAVRFWASEDTVLAQLYGVTAIDPAAQAFVDRQRADRRGTMEQLAATLGKRGALATLMVLTSYETYRELRLAGLDDRAVTRKLQQDAQTLLPA